MRRILRSSPAVLATKTKQGASSDAPCTSSGLLKGDPPSNGQQSDCTKLYGPFMKQQTCAIIKPDAIRDGFIGDILSTIVFKGLRIVDLFFMTMTKEHVAQFYAEHIGKPFYQGLEDFSTSGPMAFMILEGENAVSKWRFLMGSTDPSKASPDTLRARFGKGMPNNALHGSDSPDSAKREINLIKKFKNEASY